MKKIVRQIRPMMERKGFEYHRGGFIRFSQNMVILFNFEIDRHNDLEYLNAFYMPCLVNSMGEKKLIGNGFYDIIYHPKESGWGRVNGKLLAEEIDLFEECVDGYLQDKPKNIEVLSSYLESLLRNGSDEIEEKIFSLINSTRKYYFDFIGRYAFDLKLYDLAQELYEHYLLIDNIKTDSPSRYQDVKDIVSVLREVDRDDIPSLFPRSKIGDYDERLDYYFDYKVKS